jgi:hypothetical protein
MTYLQLCLAVRKGLSATPAIIWLSIPIRDSVFSLIIRKWYPAPIVELKKPILPKTFPAFSSEEKKPRVSFKHFKVIA